MIKGIKKVFLTKELILSKISSYDIFRFYMPNKNWEIDVVTLSPFRDEKHPSFVIGPKGEGGVLIFIDFADTSLKGDAFKFVEKLYNMKNMFEVYSKIDRDFDLGFTTGTTTKKYEKIIRTYNKPEIVKKDYSFIQVKTRKFTTEELTYWNNYYQDIDDLKANNIFSVAEVYLNKKRIVLGNNELRFGYLYDGKWKIYRPLSDRRWKWMPNNVPITAMDGLDDIKDCHTAFITKSKKDYMVMKKIFPTVCAVQNEGAGCFSDENIEYIKSNSEKQILSFDSDEVGVKNSTSITNKFGFEYCNVPKKYLKDGINDWADLAKVHGLKVIEEYLINKQILK